VKVSEVGLEAPDRRSEYDAFVSYSHAADDLLAPRLQSGLQRFAKPWWKRRALRVFRDESSLSASPHLWGSIVQAMEDSAWFVLLLSPDAAQSPWVNREIGWWAANKDQGRIIPVLTDGTFGWEDGELVGDAVPASLQGVFSEEPRWVDLRFAHDEEQLDLKNPRFSAAVADIASTLRGVPKDDLESEEVRQHRRAIRTAWAAGVLLLALTVAASVLASVAVGQRSRAQLNERLAVAGQLTAYSTNTLAEDPELSILLALEAAELLRAVGRAPLPETIEALHEAIQASRLEMRTTGGFQSVDLSPDGEFLATDLPTATSAGLPSSDVLILRASNLGVVCTLTGASTVMGIAFSPVSNVLAVAHGEYGDEASESASTVLVVQVDSAGCRLRTTLEGPPHTVATGAGAARPIAWNEDGSILATANSTLGHDASITAWDVESGETRKSFRLEEPGDIAFLDQSTLLVTQALSSRIAFFDVSTGLETDSLATPDLQPGSMAVAPDGRSLVLGSQRTSQVQLWDLPTRKQRWSQPHGTGVVQDVSPDSRMVAVSGFEGAVRVFAVDGLGQELMSLAGHRSGWGAAFDRSGQHIVTVGGGETRVWDISRAGPSILGGTDLPSGIGFPVHASVSPDGSQVSFSTNSGSFLMIELTSGDILFSLTEQSISLQLPAIVSPDWRRVAWVDPSLDAWVRDLTGQQQDRSLPPCTAAKAFSPDAALVLLDGMGLCVGLEELPIGGELRSRVIDLDSSAEIIDLGSHNVFAKGGGFNPSGLFRAGRYVSVNIFDIGAVEIWDTDTRSRLASLAIDDDALEYSPGAFDPTGRYLAGASTEGVAWVLDLEVLTSGGTVEEALVFRVRAHADAIVSMALGPDGLLATSSPNSPVRLWSLDPAELLVELLVGMPYPSTVAFSPDGAWLYYSDASYDGFVIRRFPLDPDRLVELAESRVMRTFTADECRRFQSAPSCESILAEGDSDG
jgi:WD40 repeat protein